MFDEGGIKGIPTSDKDKKYYDDYKYYDIDMKSEKFNLKMIYKVLSMLFKKIKSNKTIITITGKYGDRGLSFTSDYYHPDNKYVLHLTDQYFVSHGTYDWTDSSQRARIQGKYTDNPKLIFWTTKELANIINILVNAMLKIENQIMPLKRGHCHIRKLIERYSIKKDCVNTLGRPRQRKNLKIKHINYDKNKNAMIYKFPQNLEPEKYEEYFSNLCKEQDIKFDKFINKLVTTNKKDYIKDKGEYEIGIHFEKLDSDFRN